MTGKKNVFFKDFKNKYGEIISYLIVGVLSTVVSMSVYYGLVLTILDPNDAIMLQVANVISWVVSVTFAYFLQTESLYLRVKKKRIWQRKLPNSMDPESLHFLWIWP